MHYVLIFMENVSVSFLTRMASILKSMDRERQKPSEERETERLQ